MKLNKEYITHSYIIEGVKKTREKSDVSESSLILRLFPGFPSILLNFHKIKIEREILRKKYGLTPYKQFARESAKVLNSYELEFNSDKIPFRVVDHGKIWKEWMKQYEILYSKYTGTEVYKELGYMTSVLGDEKKLFPILIKDYPIKELYGRELYKIKFDKNNTHSRNWYEIAFSEELLFQQTYHLNITNREDTLQITGQADLKRNENCIKRICKRANINIKHVTAIEQKTIYLGTNMALIPDSIETIFSIKADRRLLKQETIILTIKKA